MYVKDLRPGMLIYFAHFCNAMVISICKNEDKFYSYSYSHSRYDVYLLLDKGKLYKSSNLHSNLDYVSTFKLL